MTEQAFRKLLASSDRRTAIEVVLRDFVQGCLEDGPDEIARVLSLWATHDDRWGYPQLNLGDDEAVLEHARHYGTVQEPEAG